MRNRTEMVTTTLPGSDNEEDASDLEDSEEDWKPVDKKKGVKTPAKTPPKATTGKRGRPAGSGTKKTPVASKKPAKKVKKEESDEEEEDFDDEEEEDEDFDDDEEASDSKKKSKNGGSTKSGNSAKGNNAKSFPDKDGKFELYLFKNDLVKDFREDPKLCMWRRDGSSLLQKYLKVKNDENTDDVFFTASSVYSCWEEKRKNDFFQIGVQCVGEKKDGKVKVIDVPELAQFAAEERPKVEATVTQPADGAADAEDHPEEEEILDDEEEEEYVEEEE